MDTLDEITSENPAPRNAPSSDETPPPPQTTPEQKDETTIPSTESALQYAASNNDENEIEMLTMSNKRAIHEVSSEEEPTNPLPTTRTAPGPLPSGQDGTFVPKGAGRGVRQRSPLSTLTLQDQEDRDRLGEIGLPYDSLMVQNPLCHQNKAIKVNQRMIKIRPIKSWLTTTSSSGTVEVLGVIEKT